MNPVDDYIFNLSEQQQKLANRLRQLILTMVPAVVEKFSYKIPFYHYFGMFCYINAIPDGIDLGICRGRDLATAFPSLEEKGRAIMATVAIYSLADFEKKEVAAIIAAAADWNKEAKSSKTPLLKKSKKRS